MKKIAIVSAMEIELAFLQEALAESGGYCVTEEGDYLDLSGQVRIRGALLGVGKVNAAYRTADIVGAFSPDLVVNVGFAAGMAAGAKGGDVVVGNDYVQADFCGMNGPGIIHDAPEFIVPHEFIEAVTDAAAKKGVPVHVGRIATGDFFLDSGSRKKEITGLFSPVAFDMESAAVAHVAAKKGVAFVAVRTLSDLGDDDAREAVKNLTGGIERRPIRLVLEAIGSLYRYSGASSD